MSDLRDRRIQEEAETYRKAGQKIKWDDITKKINEELGGCWSVDAIRSRDYDMGHKRVREPQNETDTEISGANTSIEIKSDGSQISERKINASESEMKDPVAVMKFHNYDPDAWDLISSKHTLWEVSARGVAGDTLYSSRIVVKPKAILWAYDYKALSEKMDSMVVAMDRFKAPPIVKNGQMLELTFADVHFGRMAWYGNTGENYDYKIATQRVQAVTYDILDYIAGRKFEKIVCPIGNDFFNFDNPQGGTTGGTPQQNDVRLGKVMEGGFTVYAWIIDKMLDYGPVELFLVPGNHDYTLSIAAALYLRAYYRNHPHVTVNTLPSKRKYIQFGKCMLGLGHLYKDGKRIDRLMPDEESKMWGDTIFREFHGAHLHTEDVIDMTGFVLRRNPAFCEIDDWTFEEGFRSMNRNAVYIWDKENGMTDTHYTCIRRKQAANQ